MKIACFKLMKKEAQQTDILLWTKVLQSLPIFSYLSPQKLGLLLVLACCILKSRTSCLYKARDKIGSVVGVIKPKGIDYQSFIKFFSTGKGDVIQKNYLSCDIFISVSHLSALPLSFRPYQLGIWENA